MVPDRNPDTSHMEDKFELIKINENIYEGKYPLETFMSGARGTYGGEFLAQTMLAAWATVEHKLFVPNSLHSYFLKAGSLDSVMRYEVVRTNDGRSFANRTVHAFQKSTNDLCFTMIISFTKRNTHKEKETAYFNDPSGKTPFPLEIQSTPLNYIKKYKDSLDKLPAIENTNGNLVHIVPRELLDESSRKYSVDKFPPGDKKLGVFLKVNDSLDKAKEPMKMRFLDIAFASDSFWLSSIIRVLGLPWKYKNLQFFRVLLDHSIYFHDTDFDPSEWMFMDFSFPRYQNDRLLAKVQIFNLQGN